MRRTILCASTIVSFALPAFAAEVGQTLNQLELRDGNNKPAPIPDLGAKVLAIFYTDADVADMNDPLADALKAKGLSLDHYRGMGVVNMADSKAPNFIIRGVVRGKIEKYKSTILTDTERLLPKAWDLGDCNNTSVVLVVGKDKKVYQVHRGPVRGKDIDTTVALVEKLIAEGQQPAAAPAAAPAPVNPTPEAAPAPTP